MLKKILLTAGIIAITQLSQGYTMDPPQKPLTPEQQAQEERDSHDAHSNWALKEGPFKPIPGGAYDVRGMIAGMGQNLRNEFSCPTAEEVRSLFKKNISVPYTELDIHTKEGIKMEISVDDFFDERHISQFETIKKNIDKVPILFTRTAFSGISTNDLTKATNIVCYYEFDKKKMSVRLSLTFNNAADNDNYFDGNKGLPKLLNGAIMENQYQREFFVSPTNNPGDIVFQLLRNKKRF